MHASPLLATGKKFIRLEIEPLVLPYLSAQRQYGEKPRGPQPWTPCKPPSPASLRRADLNPVVYAAFRQHLLTGDIALSRPDARPSNRLIALGTGSPYVHATMIGWCGGVLMLAEARQWRESHLVTLSSQVKRWPGFYDVYRVRRPFRPTAAWTTMLRATGTPYGWGQLLGDAAHKVFGRLAPAQAQRSGRRFSPRLLGAGEFCLSRRRPHAASRAWPTRKSSLAISPTLRSPATSARCIGRKKKGGRRRKEKERMKAEG